MSRVSEDQIAGFCVLSVFLGIGAGLITFHFRADETFGWGVGIVVTVAGLFVMISFAKIAAMIDSYFSDEDEG